MKKNNGIVYLYGFSTKRESQLVNLLKIIKEQIKIEPNFKLVLLHDAVIGFSEKGKKNHAILELLNLSIKIYAIKADLLARGIDIKNLNKKINIINYENLVDLLAEIPKIVSWL
ncbi:MAG: sulfurtransferase complex subunit TusB [Promethearchaeota archaeon]|nr:MAG: sulfurtransferase complex subunit TusB [Candidatus Lokiarchaeota archaeon]